jgi:hypothetical protein
MIVTREWCMANSYLYKMNPVKNIVSKYISDGWVDPFAMEGSPADIKNGVNGEGAIDGLEFLKALKNESVSGCLFDPYDDFKKCLKAYSPKHNGTAGRAEYWSKCKDEIARIMKPSGIVISFCNDSNGIGKNRGFNIIEVMLLCHGACHKDSIVTVDKKEDYIFRL